jgi:hypothetical protein
MVNMADKGEKLRRFYSTNQQQHNDHSFGVAF